MGVQQNRKKLIPPLLFPSSICSRQSLRQKRYRRGRLSKGQLAGERHQAIPANGDRTSRHGSRADGLKCFRNFGVLEYIELPVCPKPPVVESSQCPVSCPVRSIRCDAIFWTLRTRRRSSFSASRIFPSAINAMSSFHVSTLFCREAWSDRPRRV